MGFYTKNKFLYLPNKRVVDDLIERDGLPTKESFTPYNGMNYLISEQMCGERFSILGVDVIKENIQELSVRRLKGKEDVGNDDSLSIDENYAFLLDDIHEDYIRDFMRSQLIGLKVNKTGARKVLEESSKIQNLMFDVETNKVYNISDDYVEDEFEDSFDVISEVRRKIPYLLKKLQDGSIQYGVSLLSLFIARDGVIQKLGKRSCDIKPRELLAYPIYSVNFKGELMCTLDPETANNTQKFIEPKNLVLGVDPINPYYRAGIELTSYARQLGYNLYEEDARDYSPTYINRLMCSYILSNQEVLLDIGAYDPKILELFKNGAIFDVKTNEPVPKQTSKVLKLREMAIKKMNYVPELHDKCSIDNNIVKIKEPLKLINQFFKKYKEVNLKSKMEEESTYDCTTENGVLCDCNAHPLIFKIDQFVTGLLETPGFSSVYAIITELGFVVRIDDSVNDFDITDISRMLLYVDTKDRDLFYKRRIGL